MTFTAICVGIVIFIAVVLLTGAVSWFLAWLDDDGWKLPVLFAWIASALGFAVCLT